MNTAKLKRPGLTRWLIALAAALVLAWLLPRFFREEPAPVAPPAPPTAQTAAPAPQAAAPAAQAPAPADAAADAQVVGDVDLGATVRGTLDGLTETFAGITDPASAEAALPKLTEARDALAGIEGTVSALPEAERSALRSLVAAALPSIRAPADALLTDSTIGPVVQVVVTEILGRLDALAG